MTDSEWLLVLGGGKADRIFDLESVSAYSTIVKCWIKRRTRMCRRCHGFPAPRKFHAVVQFNGVAYLSGGSDGAHALDDIWQLELSTLQWEKMNVTLPRPVYFHAAAVTPAGCMYVFGGVLGNVQQTRTNSVFKMWLAVPSLQEIVWDSLTAKFPTLFARMAKGFEKSRGAASCLGLPPKFLRRLK